MEENNNEKNLNIIIAIVIGLIILGICGLGFACYKIIQKDKEKIIVKNDSFANLQLGLNNEKGEENIDIQTKEEVNEEEQLSKSNQLLEEITEKFNSSNFSKELNENENIYMKANLMGNSINIFIQALGQVVNITWSLEDNILISKVISYEGADPYILSTKALCAVAFMDCVAQVKGYNENILLNELNKDKAMYFTLENEGVEIEVLENDGGLIYKIDLESDLSFLRR